PNSTLASGRTSTRSLRRLRRQNSASFSVAETRLLRHFNAQRPTLNAQRSIHLVGRWMVDVERWAFPLWRVKGAWWPPRSSKPSSPRLAGRGRFDSYPLRRIIFECRLPIVDCPGPGRVIFSIANRNSKIENRVKGGDIDVA